MEIPSAFLGRHQPKAHYLHFVLSCLVEDGEVVLTLDEKTVSQSDLIKLDRVLWGVSYGMKKVNSE